MIKINKELLKSENVGMDKRKLIHDKVIQCQCCDDGGKGLKTMASALVSTKTIAGEPYVRRNNRIG